MGFKPEEEPRSSTPKGRIAKTPKQLAEARPTFNAKHPIVANGMSIPKRPRPEKEKVSVTLDRTLLKEVRERFPESGLSSALNKLLHDELANRKLGELVEDMEREAGPVSQEAYDRVFALWRADE